MLEYDSALMAPTVLAYTAWVFATTIVAKRRCGAAILNGCPRWSFATSLATQICVFPALTYALSVRGLAGCVGDGERGARDAEEAAGAVYFIYWAKDLFAPMDVLFALHHSACFFGLGMAFGVLRCGRAYFLAMINAFECGSAAMNVCELFPRRRATVTVYVLGMAASNAAGIELARRTFDAGPLAVSAKAACAAVAAVVAFFRQRQALAYYRAGWDDTAGKGA